MQDPVENPGEESGLFLPGWDRYNKPSKIVTLGHYYPQDEVAAAKLLVRETRASYQASADADPVAVQKNLGWTQLISALNKERQWPLKRFVALLDPMLAPDIALAVVPTHIAHQAFWPTRALAQRLVTQARVDATSCLVRHATIRRITFGGPSTKALHRQTIHVENAPLVAGRRVLLLDDVAKSGASLMACREMLLEAGAAMVQALALGRVILTDREPGER